MEGMARKSPGCSTEGDQEDGAEEGALLRHDPMIA